MKINRFLLIICLFFYMLMCSFRLMADSVSCPKEIETTQSIKIQISGWQPSNRRLYHELSEAKVFNGRPENYESLDADEENEEPNRKLKALWHLLTDGEYWLQCAYDGTNVTLARKLPKGTKICEQHYDLSQRLVNSMSCKS